MIYSMRSSSAATVGHGERRDSFFVVR